MLPHRYSIVVVARELLCGYCGVFFSTLVCSSRKLEMYFSLGQTKLLNAHLMIQSWKCLISSMTPDCVALNDQHLFDVLSAEVFVLEVGSLLCYAV